MSSTHDTILQMRENDVEAGLPANTTLPTILTLASHESHTQPHASNSTAEAHGRSVSTRTSFTRVDADDGDNLLFPARPATAGPSMTASSVPTRPTLLPDLPPGSTADLHTAIREETQSSSSPPLPSVPPTTTAVDALTLPATGPSLGTAEQVPSSSLPEPSSPPSSPLPTPSMPSTSPSPPPSSPMPSPPLQHQQPQILTQLQTQAQEAANVVASPPQTPQAFITFLLITGRRRTMSFDPEMTVGRVKELVWNTWPEDIEWQNERPPAPSYLRLLYLGKMLQDDDMLTKLKLPISHPHDPQPTIIHLSIRPYALAGENDGFKKKRRLSMRPSRDDTTESSSGCCGCIIC
ncbi:hypothetical protein AX17_007157 [Amanita inopinata Kibby_2008]|nr:hypothetical protein AX17_007157 [Amanita inopinata Kibby_2008]